METINARNTFTEFSYWSRLPGVTAFCGIASGICAARYGLSLAPDHTPESLIYIMLLTAVIFFCAIAGILQKRQIARVIFFAGAGAALFSASELKTRIFYENMAKIDEYNQILTLNVRITSPPVTAYSGYRFRASVTGADDARVSAALRGKTLRCISRSPVPAYGEIKIQGRYAEPQRAAGPLGFDQREHFAVNNIHGSFTVSRVLSQNKISMTLPWSAAGVSQSLREHVHGIIGKASSPYARGIFHAAFLGEKEHLPEELTALFRRSGIVHLLAISGFHAALLYGSVFFALSLFGIPSKTRSIVALAVLWGYLFFIGFIPSLFRAAMMVTFFCLSMLLQRKNHAVHSLGIAGACWLFISPHSLFAPGFQLSFAATAGIILLSPILGDLTRKIVDGIRSKPAGFIVGKILSPLGVSAAAFAATAPPLVYHFGTLSLFGILFNVVAIPLMSAAMCLFFAAIILSPIDTLSGAAIWSSEKTLDALTAIAGLSERVSVSEIVVPRATALQLVAVIIFMIGLCAVRKNLRGAFALKAGATAAMTISLSALYASMTAKTENVEFTRNATTANVVVHKDNTAWIVAQGSRSDIRRLREREIEPFLYRRKIKNVPLFIISEEAEEEAHEFSFATDHAPQIISLRKNKGGINSRQGEDEKGAYITLNAKRISSADKSCELRINDDGKMEISP